MGKRLILVDSQREWLNQSSDALSSYGYEVQTAADLEQAFEHIQEQVPHLLLLNGSQIKDLSQFRRIVKGCSAAGCRLVVMVPGTLSLSNLRRMFKAGAHDCITKPFDSHTLKAAVEMGLSARKKRGH